MTSDHLVDVVLVTIDDFDAPRFRLKRELGAEFDQRAIVFQFNKRDLPDAVEMRELTAQFRSGRCAHVESIAHDGVGTSAAIRELFELTLR